MVEEPYPGIRPFHREEAPIFFGRERQTDELIQRLEETRFLAVVGPSGCGKTSLVKTGLMAGLESGFMMRAGSRWTPAEMRPGGAPFHGLARALGPVFPDIGATDLLARLRNSPLALHELMTEIHPDASVGNLLLLVDQFEELFRYAAPGAADLEPNEFINLLLAGAQPYPLPGGGTSDNIYIIVTLRSDFIGECARFPGLAEAINAGLYLTPRLTREQLSEAIEEPPGVTGCEIEPALTQRLLADAGENPDHLPLIQHALQWLWRQAREKSQTSPPRLALADYEAMGGFGQALSDRLDAIFDQELTADQQRVAETLFRSLSRRDTEQRDIRRPIRVEQVAALADAPPETVITVVDHFRENGRYFIMPYAGPLSPDTMLDVSHESLLRQWRRMREWLADEARSAEIYRRIEQSALLHENRRGDLLTRLDLANARAWWEEKRPTPIWAERHGREKGRHFDMAHKFLKASIAAERAERRRYNGFMALLFLLICFLGLFMWIKS